MTDIRKENAVHDAEKTNALQSSTVVGSSNVFIRQDIPQPFQKPHSEDLLLGIQALGLCSISYNNKRLLNQVLSKTVLDTHWFQWFNPLTDDEKANINTVSQTIEEKLKEVTHIQSEDYRVWDDTWVRPNKQIYLESQCVTGVVNVAANPATEKDLVPFIAFRGSVSEADWLRDAKSAIPITYKSTQGKESNGCVGAGFAEMVQQLKLVKQNGRSLMEEVLHLVEKYDNGLIVTGHSLGGGCTNVFLVELLLDHRATVLEKYREKIRIVTFGSPRSVDDKLLTVFHDLPIRNLRFVNNDDLVTTLPPKSFKLYYHAGRTFFPHIANNVEKLSRTKDPIHSLPDWKTLLAQKQDSVVIWLHVFEPNELAMSGYHDISADAEPDKGIAKALDLPTAFLGKAYKTHDVVDPIGYNRLFLNLLYMQGVDAIELTVGQRAKAYVQREDANVALVRDVLGVTIGF